MKIRSEIPAFMGAGLMVVGMGLLQSAHAFFRMPCNVPVVVERGDPIINPGAVSSHLHHVFGGSGFNFTEDQNAALAGKCTSCMVRTLDTLH